MRRFGMRRLRNARGFRTCSRSVTSAGQPRRARRNAARGTREAGSGREGGPKAARQPGGQCAAPGSPPSQSEADLLRPARRSAGTGAYTSYVRIPSTARRRLTGAQKDREQVLRKRIDMFKLTKAIFPVAGLGTRFLPVTKASPKEMLPIVDKPLIQYAVEEAIAAGITEMIFVTGRSKRAIEDHFDKSYEVEAELEARGKEHLLKLVRNIKPPEIDCFYIRQPEALGLGHAVLCTEKLIGDHPFAVVLADDLLDGEPPVLKQMVEHFDRYHSSLIGVEEIPPEHSRSYGIIEGREWEHNIINLSGIIEKPAPEEAPSNLGVVGELQLTDAIRSLMNDEQALAYRYQGMRFDCGSKLGYLKATVEFALRHPEVKDEFAAYLQARFPAG